MTKSYWQVATMHRAIESSQKIPYTTKKKESGYLGPKRKLLQVPIAELHELIIKLVLLEKNQCKHLCIDRCRQSYESHRLVYLFWLCSSEIHSTRQRTKSLSKSYDRKMEDTRTSCLSSREMQEQEVRNLKKSAPPDKIVRCYIDAKTHSFGNLSFELWHGVPPRHVNSARCVDNGVSVKVKGKFLLAARKRIIFSDPNMSKGTVVGKLEKDVSNRKFTIYDNQSSHTTANLSSKTNSRSHIWSTKSSRGGHATSFKAVAKISYEVASRTPPHMTCCLLTIPASVMDSNRSARSTPLDFLTTAFTEDDATSSFGLGGSSKSESAEDDTDVAGFHSRSSAGLKSDGALVLNTKVENDGTRWNLASFPPDPVASGLPIDPNFLLPHERVRYTITGPYRMSRDESLRSFWNFQVVAVCMESSQTSSQIEEVVLHVHKCGKQLYRMDYLYPLSAFQAFAICLSRFDKATNYHQFYTGQVSSDTGNSHGQTRTDYKGFRVPI